MTDRVRGRTEEIIRLAASESCGDATTCLLRGRFVVRDVTRSAPPLVTPRLPLAVAAWAAVGFAFAKPPGSCKFESEIVIPGVFPIHLREYRQDLDRTLVVSLFNGSDQIRVDRTSTASHWGVLVAHFRWVQRPTLGSRCILVQCQKRRQEKFLMRNRKQQQKRH